MINIKKLEWDSNYFGINIAELTLERDTVDKVFFEKIINQSEFDFIQSKVSIADVLKISNLEKMNFKFADLKVTFTLNLKEFTLMKDERSLVATEYDSDALKKISRGIFIDSRYYGYENLFSKYKVDELYEIWLEKSIMGVFDDICLKYCIDNQPVGFVTLKILSERARIGLIGVSNKFQSQGVGGKLIRNAVSFLRNKNVDFLDVSTQGKNIIAENFYIKQGFRLKEIESWYYYC